jgi:hypothetical protein
MTTIAARLRCGLTGHDWEWGLPSGHSWCRRCKRYDDAPAILRAEKITAAARKWLPLWITLRNRDLTVRLGWSWRINLSLSGRVHYGWRADTELPGIGLTAHAWRFEAYAGVGFAWPNEDGERSLLHVGASFHPGGLERIVCRLRGHAPGDPLSTGACYCERCDERLDVAEKDEPIAA